MSQITMTIIAEDQTIHGQPHASFVDVVVAALSAEPETIDDLRVAIGRFQCRDGNCFGGFRNGRRDEPYDAGLCIVDLPGRVVHTESTYSRPSASGELRYHDGKCATDKRLPYHVSDDWEFVRDEGGYNFHADKAREARAANPPLDRRQVLYGARLSEFIVKECFAARGGTSSDNDDRHWTPPEGWEFRELVKRFEDDREPRVADAVAEIHARWLMTPRKDLRDRSPREVLMEKRCHISWDMQDRCEAWSVLNFAPPPLSTESQTYKFGGPGPHEKYVYYDLVRELVWLCWDRVVAGDIEDGPVEVLQANESERLNNVRVGWLNSPNPELSSHSTPGELIDNERRRIPEAGSGKDAMADEDCPCCQMMADMPGPFFWHLDGCNDDEDFAFSDCATMEKWEEEEREREDWNREWAAREAKRKRDDDFDFAMGASVWNSSSVVSDADPKSPVSMLSLGFHLAELIGDLKALPEGQDHVDALNRQFGNFRETMRTKSGALLEPVVNRFCEDLQTVAEEHTGLAAKCDDLANSLKRVAAAEPYDDVPF